MILMTMIVGITMTSCGGNNNSNKMTDEEIQQMKLDSINRVVNEFTTKNSLDTNYTILNVAGDSLLYSVEKDDSKNYAVVKKSDISTGDTELAYNPNERYEVHDVLRFGNGVGYMFFMKEKSSKKRPNYLVTMYNIVEDTVVNRITIDGSKYYNIVYGAGYNDDEYEVTFNSDWYLYDEIGPVERSVTFDKETGTRLTNRTTTIFGDELITDDYLNRRITPATTDIFIEEWAKGRSTPERYLIAYSENPIRFKEMYGSGYNPVTGRIESIVDGNGSTNFIDYMFGPDGYLVVLSAEVGDSMIGIKCWITDKKIASKLSVGQELTVWGSLRVDNRGEYLEVPNAVCSFIDPFIKTEGDKIAAKMYLQDAMYYAMRNGWLRPE